MLSLIKQVFMGLLCLNKSISSVASSPEHVKCISLNNKQYMTQLSLINLRHNEYIEGLLYYPFAVNSVKCMGSFNILNDLSSKVCIRNKT